MSDTYRRYRAIKQGIMQFYQVRPSSHHEKHFNTLVALICGLIGGKQAQLPIIAAHAPCPRIRQQSLTKRFGHSQSIWLWMAVSSVVAVWP